MLDQDDSHPEEIDPADPVDEPIFPSTDGNDDDLGGIRTPPLKNPRTKSDSPAARALAILLGENMKTITAGLLMATSLFLVSMQPSQAQGSMSTSAPMMAMPTCASGDPVVGVNTTTKMYMTQDQMKAKMSGMTDDQKQAMMKKNNVEMMCKSKADEMGAKMMTTPPE